MKVLLIVIAILVVAVYVVSLMFCKFLRDLENKKDDESSEPKY